MAVECPKKDQAVSSEGLPVDIDESILDEEDPVTVKKAVDATPSIAETLALIFSQLLALNQCMDYLESGKVTPSASAASTSSVTREAKPVTSTYRGEAEDSLTEWQRTGRFTPRVKLWKMTLQSV